MKKLTVVSCLLSVGFTAFASTWTGGGASGLWNDPNNWDGGVPAADGTAEFATDVTITDNIALPGQVRIYVEKDKTVSFNGVISDGTAQGSLVIGSTGDQGGSRAGSVRFNATNAFTGHLYVYHGKVYAGADNAFGAVTGSASVYVKPRDDSSVSATGIYLTDVECLRDIILQVYKDDNEAYRDYLNVNGDVMLGKITCDGQFRGNFGLEKPGRCTLSAGGVFSGLFIPNVGGGSEIYVINESIKFFPYNTALAGRVVLASKGNMVNENAYKNACFAYPLLCETDDAFSAKSVLCFEDNKDLKKNSELDLNSTTQSVLRLYSSSKAADIADEGNYGRVKSAKGGLITVNDTGDFDNYNVFQGEASVELNLAAGKTATFCAKSTSSGDLIATQGNVVFASNGQWAGRVWIKTGTRVTMPASAFAETTRVKLDGGTLVLPDKGSVQVAEIVDADGNPLPAGVYGKDAASGVTPIEGVEGEGQLAVIPLDPTSETVWEWQGGSGPNVSTWANWKGATATEKPDFNDLGNVLKFPVTAGVVTFDVPVKARGLVVEGSTVGQAVFFSATGDGSLYMQKGQVEVADAQVSVDLNVPLRYHGTLVATVPSQSVLRFDGSITTVGDGDLYVNGAGTAWFVGDANIIDGNVVASNAYVYVSGKDPLGGRGVLEIRRNATYSLMLSNAVVTRAVHRYTEAHIEGVCAGTTNWCVDLVQKTSFDFPYFGVYTANAELNVDGQVLQQNNYENLYPYALDSSTVRICQRVNSRRKLHQASTDANYGRVALACASNLFDKTYCRIAQTLALEVEDAIDGEVIPRLQSNKATIDLCGTTQHLYSVWRAGTLGAGDKVDVYGSSNTEAVKLFGGQIRGGTGSRLVITGSLTGSPSYGTSDAVQDTFPRVGEAVALERAGSGTTVIREPCASTGEVAVTSGRLEFAPAGSKWTWYKKNGTSYVPCEQTSATAGSWSGDARVSGGTLALGHDTALTRDADIYLEGGALELATGTTVTVDHLYLKVNGEWVQQAGGLYGATDNMSVPADHRLSLITGGGVLRVRHPSGVVLIVR